MPLDQAVRQIRERRGYLQGDSLKFDTRAGPEPIDDFSWERLRPLLRPAVLLLFGERGGKGDVAPSPPTNSCAALRASASSDSRRLWMTSFARSCHSSTGGFGMLMTNSVDCLSAPNTHSASIPAARHQACMSSQSFCPRTLGCLNLAIATARTAGTARR